MTSLRERKKLRTRSTLVDAAADLCLRQGYEKTTVEQIAAAAEVSPRTFSRYFPTKDAVIAAIADEVDGYVADALARQPSDITEHEALLRAHLQIFASDAPVAPAAFHRMTELIQIVNASATLDVASFSFKQRYAGRSIGVLGQRMGLPPEHAAVRLVADSWTAVFRAAFGGLGTPGNDPIEAPVLCRRLTTTFETFTRTWTPWCSSAGVDGQPPGGAPSR